MNINIEATEFDDNTARDLLTYIYTTYLMRQPDEIGVAFYLPVIKDFGYCGYMDVVNSILYSSEMKNIFTQELKEIWIKSFEREPEDQEIESYKDLIRFYRQVGHKRIEEKINLAKELSEQARKLNDDGQYKQVEQLLNESQKECIAGLWQYWHELGRAQFRLGKFELAVLSYQKSIRFNRDDEWFWSCEDLKWAYQEIAKSNPEKYKDALQCFLSVANQLPNRWVAWHECGYFAGKMKDYQNAISYYHEAINRNKKNLSWAWSAIDLMNCYKESGLTTEAYEYFINITQRQPDRWGNWHARASVEWDLKNKNPDAIVSYRKAIELNQDGGWFWSWSNLGDCLKQLDRDLEAYDAFKQASNKESMNSDIWLKMSRVAKKLGQWDLCYDHLFLSITLDQNSEDSWNDLYNYYLSKPEPEYFYAWLAYKKITYLSEMGWLLGLNMPDVFVNNRHRADLRKIIYASFDKADFKIFCYDLGMNYDDLSGETLPEKQISLIDKCFNSGKENQLIMQIQIDRQNKLPKEFHPQYFKL